VNLSLGTVQSDRLASLYDSFARLRREGLIVVAAVRQDGWSYPAVFEPVLGVGSAAVHGLFEVEYRPSAAIECGVRTSHRPVRGVTDRLIKNSTSFAAPVVTGLVARWLGDDPSLDLDGVRNRFLECARPRSLGAEGH